VEKIFINGSSEYRMIFEAVQLVEFAFAGKKRLDSSPYTVHLYYVGLYLLKVGVRDAKVIVAGLLHDMVEDVPGWNFFWVWRIFGFRIAWYVMFVTKLHAKSGIPRPVRMWLFYNLLRIGPRISQLIKVCDRTHNLKTLSNVAGWKQRRAIASTEALYQPLARKLDREYPGTLQLLLDALVSARNQLNNASH
jgi:GTP pyrophosphokinase